MVTNIQIYIEDMNIPYLNEINTKQLESAYIGRLNIFLKLVTWAFFKVLKKLDLAKLTRDPRPETRTERPEPIPDPTRHRKYAHPKVDPKSKLTRIEPYPIRIFLQSCLFWRDKRIWPKISWLEIDLNRTITDPNRNIPKSHLTRTWPNSNLTWPVPESNNPFIRSKKNT